MRAVALGTFYCEWCCCFLLCRVLGLQGCCMYCSLECCCIRCCYCQFCCGGCSCFFGAVALSVLDVRTDGAVYRKMLHVLFTCAVADVAGAVPADAAPPREETYNILMN